MSRAKKSATVTEEPTVETTDENVRYFTYIGAGEGSPYVINFMGKQRFTRGQATPVSDPELLAKLDGGIATFVEGEIEMETIHEIDSEAKNEADKKRALDLEINAKFSKKHRVE